MQKSSTETKTVAAACAKTICSRVSPNALSLVLPTLHSAVHFESRWQTRVAGLEIIAEFSNHAPEQLGHALPSVIPEVSQCIVDLKAEVRFFLIEKRLVRLDTRLWLLPVMSWETMISST